MSESVVATKPKTKHPDEQIGYAVDFTSLLASGETLSSVDEITSAPSGDLTIESEAVNVSTITGDDGDAVAVGKAATFTISGGDDGTDYRITVVVTTSTGNQRTGVMILQVRDGSV